MIETEFLSAEKLLENRLEQAIVDYTVAVRGLLRLNARVGRKYVPPRALLHSEFLVKELGYKFCPDRASFQQLVDAKMEKVGKVDCENLPTQFPCWIELIYDSMTHGGDPHIWCVVLSQEDPHYEESEKFDKEQGNSDVVHSPVEEDV